jgi:sialate O-acetylesterase
MASAVDIGDMGNMHPTDKHDLAHRLVLVGAKVANGESLADSDPTFQSIQVEGMRSELSFQISARAC